MMTQRNLWRALLRMLVAAVIVATAGCATSVGPEGPPGAEGPHGPTGPEGPRGEDGNANVVGAVVELTDADWGNGTYVYRNGPNATTSRGARVVTLAVPQITQEIFDLGMVHVFLKVPESLGAPPVAWAPLPYQFLAFGDAYHYNIAFTYNVGTLRLYYYHSTNDDGVSPPSVTSLTLADMSIKYVITGAQAIELLARAGVDHQDHDAVLRFFQGE